MAQVLLRDGGKEGGSGGGGEWEGGGRDGWLDRGRLLTGTGITEGGEDWWTKVTSHAGRGPSYLVIHQHFEILL